MKFGKFRYWHRPISIVADTGQYIWEISTKCIINCSKYKIHSSPPVGTATHLSVLQFYYFGSLAFTTMAFFEISSVFIIKSSVDHTSYNIMSYVWSNTYISNIHPIFWLIGHKSSGNCRNFIIYILHIVPMYSHSQIVHIVWLIGIKTNGNY